MTKLVLAVLAAVLVAGLMAGALPGAAHGQAALLEGPGRDSVETVCIA